MTESGPILEPSREPGWLLVSLLTFAALVFGIGINWGLPSRRVDPFLFGSHPVWTGEQILRLAPVGSTSSGADVDVNPLPSRERPVLLNETDAQRAEIIRRYRLFSYQPDEMITFASLSAIRQTRGDPRLYQYGGLWIYPVGALLGVGGAVGLVDLRSDAAYYLDHPEAFGRFYIVARLYAAGARHIVLTNTINLGLVPAIAANGAQAIQLATGMSLGFNQALATQVVPGLRAGSPGLSLYLVDLGTLSAEIVGNPGAFGLTNVTAPCYPFFSAPAAPICATPSQFLWWDELHPTTAVHEIAAQRVIATIGR